MTRFAIRFLAFLLCHLSLHAQVVAPVERRGFSSLTSYDELQLFLSEIPHQPTISVQQIAQSVQGRNISLVTFTSAPRFGSDQSKLRVLLFAQQHGDEPSGKEAMTLLLAKAANGDLSEVLKRIDLMIVPQMNPDGSETRQRRTADSIDLNRNHLLLTSPATKTLHDVFYQWMPHVTVDIHEYGSFSTEWSDSGFIKTGDVQLGMLTNLNTSQSVRDIQHREIFPFIAETMRSKGYSFHEYIVGTPGMYIRHSTTEINDGRQSFGILGTVSFIQEGRKWRTIEDQLQRRALSQLTSAEAMLEFCSEHAPEIRQLVDKERSELKQLSERSIALRMDHFSGGKQMFIPVQLVKRGLDTTWEVRSYREEVRLLESVTLPKAYAVRRTDTSLIALLRRHHIKLDSVKRKRTLRAEEYLIDSVGQWVLEEDTLPLVSVTRRAVTAMLDPGDLLISTAQLQSRLLAIILEPESQWGLTKYDQFAYIRKQKQYPIKRIP